MLCAQLCLPLQPVSSLQGIFQTRILEWVAISYSRGSSQPRDQTHVFCISYIGRHSLPLCHLDTFKVYVSLSYPWIQDSPLGIFLCVDFLFTSQHSLISYKTFLKMRFYCCSVAQSCPTLCNPMDCSTSGFPVLPLLPELAQTHVHWVGDVIQPSHLLLSSSLPAFNLSQHWSFQMSQFFASGGPSIGTSALVLPVSIQDWFPLGLTGYPCSPRDSQESSPTPQFQSVNSSALSLLYGPAVTYIMKFVYLKFMLLMVFGTFTKLYSHHYNFSTSLSPPPNKETPDLWRVQSLYLFPSLLLTPASHLIPGNY